MPLKIQRYLRFFAVINVFFLFNEVFLIVYAF